jgi:ABC-type sugar transport system ATPase subunit
MAVDMTQKPILVVKDLNVHYDTGKGPAKAVNDVSFSLRPGERLGLIGEIRIGQDDDGDGADAPDPCTGTDRLGQRRTRRAGPAEAVGQGTARECGCAISR